MECKGTMKKIILLLLIIAAGIGCFFQAKVPIHEASRKGDLESINRYLDEGGDIDAHSPKDIISRFTMKETPLHHAVIGNQIEAAKLLLDKGANPNSQNTFDMTPLHYAVASGHTEMIALLLERKANPNAAGRHRLSPLQFALSKDYSNYLKAPLRPHAPSLQFGMIDMLLSKGADLEHRDQFGVTAFLIASKLLSVELLQHLLNKGADPLALNDAGENALFFLLEATGSAVDENSHALNIFKFLTEKGIDIRHKNNKQQSLIHYACHQEIMDYLIKQGLDINATDANSTTPIHGLLVSLDCHQPDASIKRLLIAGADPNIRDTKGRTPLHRITGSKSHLSLLPLLLEHGADLSVRSKKYGDTPLHLAARNRYATAEIELLLKHGADIDEQNDAGCTPLHKSIFAENQPENFGLLVAKGADANIQEKNGVAPLHLLASNQKHFELWGTLLLSQQAKVSIVDNTGRTPLDWAVESKIENAVTALKKRNAPRGSITRTERITFKEILCQKY